MIPFLNILSPSFNCFTTPHVAIRPHRQHIQITELFQVAPPSKSTEPLSLTVKKPLDSYVVDDLELTKDPALSAYYENPLNPSLRVGLLLEDMDIMAGRSAYLHSDGFNPKRPLKIVTACVDSISIFERLPITMDYRLESQVIHVGRSSMDVAVRLSQKISENQWRPALKAQFVMVARDSESKSAIVHPLDPLGEGHDLGLKNSKRKRERRMELIKQSLERTYPTSEESRKIPPRVKGVTSTIFY